MHRTVTTIPIPDKLCPGISQGCYQFELMEINGNSTVLKELTELRKKDAKEFKKLLATLVIQAKSRSIILPGNRLSHGKQDSRILEFKGNKGSYRLFGFQSEGTRIIICTNTYIKTTGKKNKQDQAFEKAGRMKELYYRDRRQR